MKQVRILRVVGSMERGGLETSIMHVLRAIDSRQFAFDFVYVDPHYGSFDREIRERGSRIFACSKHQLLRFRRRFLELVAQYGPYDVMHASLHRFSGYVAKVASDAGIPVRIVHSHTNTAVLDASRNLLWRGYATLQSRWVHKYATHGLAVSADAARSLFGEQWRQDPRWRVLYQGRDLEPYAKSYSRDAVRDELGLPRDAFVLAHVGRLRTEKNHRFLLEVAREVLRARVDTHLLVVGDGPCRAEIEATSRALGLHDRVHFPGERHDVARLLKGAVDVLVFPSTLEGLPMAVVEAQAAGVPCVYSDTITKEVEVVPGLLSRLSLTDGPDKWASAVLHAPPRDDRALTRVLASPFNIGESVRALEEMYLQRTRTSREWHHADARISEMD